MTKTMAANGTGGEKIDVSCLELHQLMEKLFKNPEERGEYLNRLPRVEVLDPAPLTSVYHQLDKESSEKFESGEGYRCKCSFQFAEQSSFTQMKYDDDDTANVQYGYSTNLAYAVRENGKITPLSQGIFPPANIQIRRAMFGVLKCINEVDETVNKTNKLQYKYRCLRENLTSITFISSWGDGVVEESLGVTDQAKLIHESDCLVTLHYCPPGLPSDDDIEMRRVWKREATLVCQEAKITSLTGRSRAIKITVLRAEKDEISSNPLDEDLYGEGIIHDDLWITLKHTSTENAAQASVSIESVSLVPKLNPDKTDGKETTDVRVIYHKPSTAFQHPNARVMLSSLHWILNVLSRIIPNDSHQGQPRNATKPRLLEMYCGCGAHTIPLAKSSLLSEIVAVELDDRLVRACRLNCRVNNCFKTSSGNSEGTHVEVLKGDAAEWAVKTLRAQYKRKISSDGATKNENFNHFDILLVDPPRGGLDRAVCDMAIKGTFSNMIYVSCGRRALLRDLDLLCMGGFDVVDLAVIDLFPGTDAVESLVHLTRR
mmetsp:Transcript_8450/g.17810  ORF Transcript_8450/g.17810 Transcript_8450/m.17810 type:complete len:543 (+) Transcript_8450:44-1672(+)